MRVCAPHFPSPACQAAEVDNSSSSLCGDCGQPRTIRCNDRFAGHPPARIAAGIYRLGPAIVAKTRTMTCEKHGMEYAERATHMRKSCRSKVFSAKRNRCSSGCGGPLIKPVQLLHASKSNTLTYNLFLHSRNRCDLGYGFGDPSNEGVTLLGVGDVLTMKDLKFSVFLNKSEDRDRIVGEHIP